MNEFETISRLSWEAWITLGVVALCVALLTRGRPAPDVVLMSGVTLLLVSGVLKPAQALAGLANEGLVTVAVLYVVVAGVRETGGIGWLVQSLLARPRSLRHAQFRMMLPVAGLSAFMNNTPIVAMFIDAVQDWAKRHDLPLSRLMIPLSYASIAGGTCTLIGTSTNLVVNSLMVKDTALAPFALFDLVWIGVPIVVTVLGFLVLFGSRLLPDRRSALSRFEDARAYTVEMLIEPGSPLVGKTIEDAGLRQLPGMYLVEIDRQGEILPAVGPRQRLRAEDRLVFAGVVESVLDLRRIRGLTPASDQVFKLHGPRHERCLIEAVVSNSCPLLGKSIREGRFRSAYNAAVIAVARNGERIDRKIGDIVLRAGDPLLLEARPSFVAQQRNSRDFFLVSPIDDSQPPRHERAAVAAGIVILMVALAAGGVLSMMVAAMFAAGLMLVTGCTGGDVARRAVDWKVVVVIAASVAIGNALQASGAAGWIAETLTGLAVGQPYPALALVFLATALFSALVTNNAAAVIMFPIALAAARTLEVSFLPFAVTLMVGASASFATPIGYQTNLMVYGPGGYYFTDYLRVGLPLTLVVGLVTVGITPLIWPF